jgi:precorrin-2 dehydrogenase/sirohydrochlorin ferrochelatase
VPDYFPAFLDLRGRRCLVVGGGAVGERKVQDLLACGASVMLVSPSLTHGLAALAAGGRLRHRARPFRRGDAKGCVLVVAATGTARIDSRVAAEARRRRALVNVVDRPLRCDVIMPSVLRRGELQIAVSTGGRSPALAREIRERLEPLFAPDLGDRLEEVGRQRRRDRARARSAAARAEAGERAARRALGTGAAYTVPKRRTASARKNALISSHLAAWIMSGIGSTSASSK